MTYHYHGIDAEESILTKSLPNMGTWALPNLFFIIKTRVTEVSLPKWSLGSPHSDFFILCVKSNSKNNFSSFRSGCCILWVQFPPHMSR